jgi:hypothetical protein
MNSRILPARWAREVNSPRRSSRRWMMEKNSPTFEFRSDQAPKMFTRYARHFENTWNLAEDWTS